MAQDDWATPQSNAGEPWTVSPTTPAYGPTEPLVSAPWAAAEPPPPQRFAYELRPLSLGELLDRTFALFRENFWLFAGIAAITGVVSLVLGLIQDLGRYLLLHNAVLAGFFTIFGGIIIALFQFVAYGITYATLVYALGEVYLGKTTDILSATKAILPKWYRYAGIVLWQFWSGMWVSALAIVPGFFLIGLSAVAGGAASALGFTLFFLGGLGGMVYGVIAYIRNSLAIAATVIEQLPVRASMRRSKDLAAGTKGRIFVVYLIWIALLLAISMADVPYFISLFKHRGEFHVLPMVWAQIVAAVGHTLVTPVLLIGLALVYFDQRVRKEALDLVMMMGSAPPPVAPVAEPVAVAPYAAPAEAAPLEAAPVEAAPVEALPVEPPAANEATEAGPSNDGASH